MLEKVSQLRRHQIEVTVELQPTINLRSQKVRASTGNDQSGSQKYVVAIPFQICPLTPEISGRRPGGLDQASVAPAVHWIE